MELKYAFSILFSNLGQTLKILVWRIISVLITIGFACAVFIPLWHVFEDTTNMLYYSQAINNCVSDFLHGSLSLASFATGLIAHITSFIVSLGQNAGACAGLAFGTIFIYMGYSFTLGLSYYPVADMVNGKMSSNLKIGFASNMALNFKKAVKYSASRLVVALPIDILIFALTGALTLGLFKLISVGVLPIALVVVVVCITLRSMLFAGWLPRMIYHPEERVFTNFTRSLTLVKYNFGGLFKAFCVTFVISYVVAAVSALSTFGISLLLVSAIYFYLLRAVELIGYFKLNGLSFYTDATRVIDTVEFGYRQKNQHQYDTSDGDEDLQDVERAKKRYSLRDTNGEN